MLRILHNMIFSLVLLFRFLYMSFDGDFFLKSLNSHACSGRPGPRGSPALVVRIAKKSEKNVSVTSQFREFAKIF